MFSFWAAADRVRPECAPVNYEILNYHMKCHGNVTQQEK